MVQYTRAHTRSVVDGPCDDKGVPVAAHPWVGESLHPDDGYWLTRRLLRKYVAKPSCSTKHVLRSKDLKNVLKCRSTNMCRVERRDNHIVNAAGTYFNGPVVT